VDVGADGWGADIMKDVAIAAPMIASVSEPCEPTAEAEVVEPVSELVSALVSEPIAKGSDDNMMVTAGCGHMVPAVGVLSDTELSEPAGEPAAGSLSVVAVLRSPVHLVDASDSNYMLNLADSMGPALDISSLRADNEIPVTAENDTRSSLLSESGPQSELSASQVMNGLASYTEWTSSTSPGKAVVNVGSSDSLFEFAGDSTLSSPITHQAPTHATQPTPDIYARAQKSVSSNTTSDSDDDGDVPGDILADAAKALFQGFGWGFGSTSSAVPKEKAVATAPTTSAGSSGVWGIGSLAAKLIAASADNDEDDMKVTPDGTYASGLSNAAKPAVTPTATAPEAAAPPAPASKGWFW
jgi:hypothetical protein